MVAIVDLKLLVGTYFKTLKNNALTTYQRNAIARQFHEQQVSGIVELVDFDDSPTQDFPVVRTSNGDHEKAVVSAKLRLHWSTESLDVRGYLARADHNYWARGCEDRIPGEYVRVNGFVHWSHFSELFSLTIFDIDGPVLPDDANS